jgi:hypothetical protein
MVIKVTQARRSTNLLVQARRSTNLLTENGFVKDKGARHPSRSNRVTRNPELLNVISQLRICTSEVLDQNLKVFLA